METSCGRGITDGDGRAGDITSVLAKIRLAAVVCFFGCASTVRTGAPASQASPVSTPRNAAPDFMLGLFDDDYGGSFSISSTDFVQLPRGRFHIVEWNVPQQYFIAQNDSLNRADPNKWTRIDWMPLSGMEPYTWAFCFSAYKAASRADANTTLTARRDTPRTGCSGFPFTRMKRRS